MLETLFVLEKKRSGRSNKSWTSKPMLLFSTPDAPGVEDRRFPDGFGPGSQRIYGVHGTSGDFQLLWRTFATHPSVDAFDP